MIDTETTPPHAGGAALPSPETSGEAPRRWRGGLDRRDRRALLLLALLPVLVDVPFSLAGHPLLQGDNLTQNYPLRVLVGEVLRSGRLPAWDPLIWSGTPLLAGWNAGAMFPATWLFAILPKLVAWTLNVLVAPVLTSVGGYLLLRRLSCQWLAAATGALALTWAGFMGGQVVHVGLVQGASFLPWSLLGLQALHRRLRAGTRLRGLAGPVVLLGVSSALTVLAGDPRAPSSAGVVLLVCFLAACWRSPRRAGALLAATLAAGFLAACLSALQWLPGIGFLRTSQRGNAAYTFFGAGSLSPTRLPALLLLPFADGGNGNFGQPVYAGSYNLPEITVGMGLLAAVAFMAFLPEVVSSLVSWRPGRAATGDPTGDGEDEGDGDLVGGRRPLGVWYVLAVVGTLLTLGTDTPLGHLLVHIPLFGGERLQNRNAEILDLALAVLLAFLVEDLVGSGGASRRAAGRAALCKAGSRALAVVPLVAAVALEGYVVLDPRGAQSHFGNASFDPSLPGRLAPYLAWELLVVLGALGIVLARRLPLPRRRVLVVVVALLDIGCFLANASYATAPARVANGPTAESRALGRLAGANGRVALYNPQFANPTTNGQALNELGVSDLNIVQGNPSVQGYGSIVDSTYDAATDTHLYEDLDPRRLPGETFNTLDLSALATTPQELTEPIPSHAPIPVAGGPAITADGRPASGAAVPETPPSASGPWLIGPGKHRQWQLGSPVQTARLDVVVNPERGGRPRQLRVALVVPGRALHFTAVAVSEGQARLSFPGRPRATGVVVEDPPGATAVVGAVVVVTERPAQRLLLDGQLQGLLEAPHWRYVASIGPFPVYRNTETRGLAWLQPLSTHTPNTASVASGTVRTVFSSLGAGEQGEQMVVRTPKAALLVRSETYEPGWTARITPLGGGPTRVLTAHRFGLVQVVSLPAGNYRVTWRYAPGEILLGLALSALGLLLTVLLAVLAWLARRRDLAGTAEPGVARAV